jgi:hypothetical protein
MKGGNEGREEENFQICAISWPEHLVVGSVSLVHEPRLAVLNNEKQRCLWSQAHSSSLRIS